MVADRLEALREEMRREQLSAYIIMSADAHNSEYTADHWKGREWISGFNGSAGTVVVTLNSAALWTDSRYFLAAEEQLKGTEIQLMRLKMEGTPTIAEWLGRELADDARREVGTDGTCITAAEGSALAEQLRLQGGITLRTSQDLLQRVWTNRPALPSALVSIQPQEYAGETAESKLKRIREALRAQHADGMLVSALDDIAWTLNLRGQDVHCCPVFVAYLLIESQRATLYIEPSKLSAEVKIYLREAGVDTAPYTDVRQAFSRYADYNILLDPNETSHALWQLASQPRPDGTTLHIVSGETPIAQMKTMKNTTEQQGYRNAMLRDGVAMVKFLCWLDQWSSDETRPDITELDVDRKLTALRAEQPLYRDISFDTIAAYGQHGAVVHYEPTPETDIPLQRQGLLLLDSGAQYQDGTTDITRTIALGPLTDEQRRIYTLVLKGHLRLQNAVFPEGASGTQIDAIAREPLWREGLNFLHGTGHGVGSYLNVHEGPHQIRMEWKPAPLRAGMTVTDEPGIYLAGRFGVRIENTLLIKQWGETELGRFLCFEPLTLCPIDLRPVVREMLTDEEVTWLNKYHETVWQHLSPHLDNAEREWLRKATTGL